MNGINKILRHFDEKFRHFFFYIQKKICTYKRNLVIQIGWVGSTKFAELRFLSTTKTEQNRQKPKNCLKGSKVIAIAPIYVVITEY